MKRVINAAGYSPEARALDHNFYVRDEAGKLYGPYFDAQDVRFGDEQLLFVKPKSDGVYYLVDEINENGTIKTKGENPVYNSIIAKVFGKCVLVECQNGTFVFLNKEGDQCSSEYLGVAYCRQDFLEVKTISGKINRLYSSDLSESSMPEEQNDGAVVEYLDDGGYGKRYLEHSLRLSVMSSRLKKQTLIFLGGAALALLLNGSLSLAGGSSALEAFKQAAGSGVFLALTGIGLGEGISSLAIKMKSIQSSSKKNSKTKEVLNDVRHGKIKLRDALKDALICSYRELQYEDIKSRNLKKIVENNNKISQLMARLKKFEEMENKCQNILQEKELLEKDRNKRKLKLRERAKKISRRQEDLLTEETTKETDTKQWASKEKELPTSNKQTEIEKLRKELEELETENLIRIEERGRFEEFSLGEFIGKIINNYGRVDLVPPKELSAIKEYLQVCKRQVEGNKALEDFCNEFEQSLLELEDGAKE